MRRENERNKLQYGGINHEKAAISDSVFKFVIDSVCE